MRFVYLALILVGGHGAARADDWSKRWSVSGQPEMRVDVADGRIQVRQGTGKEIEARVTTEGWKISPSEVRIVEHQSGNRVELEVRVPKEWHVGISSRSIDVEIRVPANASTELRTGDGRIRVEGLHGNVRATSGDGSIEAIGFDGMLQARTGDGSIKVSGRLDAMELETGDGSIEAELTSGSKMTSAWRLHTGDGHVTVHLPGDLKANLDAHTGDGSVTVDVPIDRQSSGTNRNEVRGKMNGGGEVLMIRTGDGAIHIARS